MTKNNPEKKCFRVFCTYEKERLAEEIKQCVVKEEMENKMRNVDWKNSRNLS
ncbi:uncharacterized protein Eint_080415 [Encephalitozoon intestinalis ATCC 50506]|uniref:Uncharacterized protein n=1 Tax=Encephalitozoon intestinalis (strain ATCC 50506) TaxID=876142 RepID=W8P927_ENCIT|nr:uncharacterized protein Eint_080415 [Encephalitozoon intestinalis ATCC 50506]AHL30138.1 hypothetical protein Eint_080415 [Encephalitozoon intestinalis ATCC 50506]UTX45763.1 hypothetical protein GPK93_08g13370 [Encephalitozoon intestinalis]